jgi:hypothetical protein
VILITCFPPPPNPLLSQAARPDIFCCLKPRKVSPADPSEGLLLRFFRKLYAPFLLHWVTRPVVVSGLRGCRGLGESQVKGGGIAQVQMLVLGAGTQVCLTLGYFPESPSRTQVGGRWGF